MFRVAHTYVRTWLLRDPAAFFFVFLSRTRIVLYITPGS